MRSFSPAMLDLVKRFEACILSAYHGRADRADVWTIGWGHTGPEVHLGLTWTQEQADAALSADANAACGELYRVVDAAVIDDLTQNQFDALGSFVFNLGTLDRKTGKPHSIFALVNKRQYDQVQAAFLWYVYAGDVKVNGLVRRRSAEAELWATSEPGALEVDMPSSITRQVSTPPVARDPHPISLQGKMIAGALTVATTAGGAVKAVADQAQAYAGKAHLIDQLVSSAAIVSFGLGLITCFLMWLSHKESNT